MTWTTAGQMLVHNLYLMIYGAEGTGKTRLPTTLSKLPGGADIGYITPERGGPTSLATSGFGACPVFVVPSDGDPFPPVFDAIDRLAKDKVITTIVIDGCTVLCGRAVDFLSDGEGDKALGWDGWGQVFNCFYQLEKRCERVFRSGKSVIYTAWEEEPAFEDVKAAFGNQTTRVLNHEGGPWVKGQGKRWLPGNCDIIGRLTSRFVTKPGVKGKVFEGSLQIKRSREWKAKTRWDFLPDPCPADLNQILKLVQARAPAPGQKGQGQK